MEPPTATRHCALRCGAAKPLSLAKTWLYRVEVGAVGRQIAQRRARGLNSLAHTVDLVRAEVIHHDDVARVQLRRQHLLDPGDEGLAVDGAIQDAGCGQAAFTQSAHKRGGVPVTTRRSSQATLAPRGSTTRRRHAGRRPGLVEKDQTACLQRSSLGRPRPHAPLLRLGALARWRGWSFFKAQTQLPERLPHGGDAHPHVMLALHPIAQVRQRLIRLKCYLRSQRGLQPRQPPRHMTALHARVLVANPAPLRAGSRYVRVTDCKALRDLPNRAVGGQYPHQASPAHTPALAAMPSPPPRAFLATGKHLAHPRITLPKMGMVNAKLL